MTVAETRIRVQQQFLSLQKLNRELLESFSKYADANNCWEKILVREKTFQTSIDLLNELEQKALTEENYSLILSAKSIISLHDLSLHLYHEIQVLQDMKRSFSDLASHN